MNAVVAFCHGLNAINAYIHSGQTPESYVSYVEKQFVGIIRKDLVYGIAQGLNEAVRDVEKWVFLLIKMMMAHIRSVET